MTTDTWSWAELDEAKLELVDEAEETLGADYVLVYRHGEGVPANPIAGVEPTPLDESKLECLQGLERQVGGVAVAYSRA